MLNLLKIQPWMRKIFWVRQRRSDLVGQLLPLLRHGSHTTGPSGPRSINVHGELSGTSANSHALAISLAKDFTSASWPPGKIGRVFNLILINAAKWKMKVHISDDWGLRAIIFPRVIENYGTRFIPSMVAPAKINIWPTAQDQFDPLPCAARLRRKPNKAHPQFLGVMFQFWGSCKPVWVKEDKWRSNIMKKTWQRHTQKKAVNTTFL